MEVMTVMMRGNRRALSLVLAALWVGACGGGGGGSPVDAGQANPSLSVSPGTLRFEGQETGAAPAPGTLTVRIDDPGAAMPHVSVTTTSNGVSGVSYDVSARPIEVRVTPKAPAEVGHGTVTD